VAQARIVQVLEIADIERGMSFALRLAAFELSTSGEAPGSNPTRPATKRASQASGTVMSAG
jgi:hypothetical protein